MASYATLLARPDIRQAWVVAFEGINRYFASHPGVSAVWSDRTVIGGLTVKGTLGGSIKPMDASPPQANTITLEVIGNATTNTIFNAAPGVETLSSGTIEANATTITCATGYGTTGFPAAPGEAHVGPICFTYTGKGASNFTGVVLGAYPPLGSSPNWAIRHPADTLDPNRWPILITTTAREHYGRRFVVWHVLYDYTAAAWLTKASSRVVFVGRVRGVEFSDKDGTWSIEGKHLADDLADRKVNSPPFAGRIARRLYLPHGDYQFQVAGALTLAAGPTSVLLETMTATVAVDAGVTGAEDGDVELCRRLAAALRTATSATAMYGWIVEGRDGLSAAGEPTTQLYVEFSLPNTYSTATVQITPVGFGGSDRPNWAARALGIQERDRGFGVMPVTSLYGAGPYRFGNLAEGIYHRMWWDPAVHRPFQVDATAGEFREQPELDTVGETEGYLLIGDGDDAYFIGVQASGSPATPTFTVSDYIRDRSHVLELQDRPTVRQVWFGAYDRDLDDDAATFLLSVLTSTGTAVAGSPPTGGINSDGGFNYDRYHAAFGLGIPASLIDFRSFLDNLWGHRTYRIRDAIGVGDLMRAELALQGCYMVWNGQKLECRTMVARSTDDSVLTLSKTNRYKDATIASRKGTEGIVNSWEFKVNYDPIRDRFGLPIHIENFLSQRLVVARASAIEHRGLRVANETDLLPELVRIYVAARLFSEPPWIVTTTGNLHTLGLMPGDVVTLSETWVPNTAGGVGVLEGRAAVVLSTGYGIDGERNSLKLLVLPTANMLAPAWAVASYSAGPPTTVTVNADEYGPIERADGFDFLAASDAIKIMEHDPPDPAAPASGPWDRVVDSIAGNVITFTGGALAGFAVGRPYLVVFDRYADTTAVQRDFCFIADAATMEVASGVVYRYT